MTNPAEKIVTFKMKNQNKIPKRMEQKKRQISLSFVQDNYFVKNILLCYFRRRAVIKYDEILRGM